VTFFFYIIEVFAPSDDRSVITHFTLQWRTAAVDLTPLFKKQQKPTTCRLATVRVVCIRYLFQCCQHYFWCKL